MIEKKFEKVDLAIKCGMFFAKECVNANADKLTLTVEGFTDEDGNNYGDFEVTVKKLTKQQKTK